MSSSHAQRFGLDRSTGPVAGAVFLMSMGEELWKRFAPKYLDSLGAPLVMIGAYGSMRDLLDGLAQYPGGWLADRYGHRAALISFIACACVGYAVVAGSGSWALAFVGLVLVMAWSSMASPTLFAVVGAVLPSDRHTLAFSVQSILRRVPIVIAPAIGGLLIARYGLRAGVRIGLLVSIVLACATLGLVSTIPRVPSPAAVPAGIRTVWKALPGSLRRLLISDILVRICEALVDVFLVLYVLDVLGLGAPVYGLLVAVQMLTAIAGYFPGAVLANRFGRKPMVLSTFLAFALFPVAIASAHSLGGLVPAFVIGGLREIGEPARKAIIVSSARAEVRARSVGLYYLVRSVSIAPAALFGGIMWQVGPALPFLVAGAFGLLGALVFALSDDLM